MSKIDEYVKQLEIEGFGSISADFFKNTTKFLDSLTKINHGFTITGANASVFEGPNIIQNNPMLKPNTNSPGYIFTTRPDLNLTTSNIKHERRMVPLLTNEARSTMRAIRLLLSPRLCQELAGEYRKDNLIRGNQGGLTSPLINPSYPFLAVSDNCVKSLTGWPSSQVGIHSTNPGIMKEVHIMADGPMTFYNNYSLNLSLKSMMGSPNLYLYYYWMLYISFVLTQANGMMPWPEYLANGRLDYTTRIYRFIMDETRTFVRETACCGYAIPTSIDIGPMFDYQDQSENPRPYVDKTVDIEFSCVGALYNDELIIKQFNDTVTLFNPFMKDGAREKYYFKVDKKYQRILNNKCLPRINPVTREMEWWVTVENLTAARDLLLYSTLESNRY